MPPWLRMGEILRIFATPSPISSWVLFSWSQWDQHCNIFKELYKIDILNIQMKLECLLYYFDPFIFQDLFCYFFHIDLSVPLGWPLYLNLLFYRLCCHNPEPYGIHTTLLKSTWFVSQRLVASLQLYTRTTHSFHFFPLALETFKNKS